MVGYFSAYGRTRTGSTFYRHEDGREVEVTEVIEEGRTPLFNYPDSVCIGAVTQFIRKGMDATVDIFGGIFDTDPEDEVAATMSLIRLRDMLVEESEKASLMEDVPSKEG